MLSSCAKLPSSDAALEHFFAWCRGLSASLSSSRPRRSCSSLRLPHRGKYASRWTRSAGTGNVVLRRDTHDQFVTGFQVTSKRPPFIAKFQAGLLRCASVNTLAALAGCGTDQLKKGEVFIDEKGAVKVHLFGAVPLTDYEVSFVAFDASSEVSLGTLTTNRAWQWPRVRNGCVPGRHPRRRQRRRQARRHPAVRDRLRRRSLDLGRSTTVGAPRRGPTPDLPASDEAPWADHHMALLLDHLIRLQQ